MTLPATIPPSLDDQSIAAYQATILHHGNVVHRFSANFVNLFALFNAGGFSASMAILATPLGTEMFTTYPVPYRIIMTLFALGFIASGFLMVMIFDYSLHKYWEYRDALAAGRPFVPIQRLGTNYKLYFWGLGFFGTTIIITIVAIFLSLGLFYTFEPKKTPPQGGARVSRVNEAQDSVRQQYGDRYVDHIGGPQRAIVAERLLHEPFHGRPPLFTPGSISR